MKGINQKFNNPLDNSQNNSGNLLMKSSQYTPQSIPIPNVSTNYSSFDGIDNIEKTLEEVKELIEKSKALSLGEIVSPSNHNLELNEKGMNNLDNTIKQESIDYNNKDIDKQAQTLIEREQKEFQESNYD